MIIDDRGCEWRRASERGGEARHVPASQVRPRPQPRQQGTGPDAKQVTFPLTFQARVANQMTAFQYGHERLHVRGTMHYGRYDRQIWQNGIMKAPGALYGFSMARQDFGVMSDVQKQYRLKVLYEYGNSQYQFAADATPTQVLPNLVPVV